MEENPGQTKLFVARRFNVKPQTLNDMLKNKDKIRAAVENPDARKQTAKRLKKILRYEYVDAALFVWFKQVSTHPNLRIDGEMLLQCCVKNGGLS